MLVGAGIGLLLLVWYGAGPSAFGEESHQGKVSIPAIVSGSMELLEGAGSLVVIARKQGASALGIRSKGTLKDVGVEDTLTVADLASHVYITRGLRNMWPGITIVSEEKDDAAESAAESVTPPDVVGTTRVSDAVDSEGWVPAEDVTVWIDPLDATREYSQNLVQYVTVMACVCVKGQPVASVIHKPFENRTEWAWIGHGRSVHRMPTKSRPGETRITVSMSHAGSVKDEAALLGADPEKGGVVGAAGAGYKVLSVLDGDADMYLHKTKIKKWDVCAGDVLLRATGGVMTDWAGNGISYGAKDSPVLVGGLIAARTTAAGAAAVDALKGRKPGR